MKKQMFAMFAVLCFAVVVQGGVTLSTTVGVNSVGDDIYHITVTSDAGPITSLGVNVLGDGNIGQIHPAGFPTYMCGDYSIFFILPDTLDQDTCVPFSTAGDSLLVVSGAGDTVDELDVNFTGFAPFQSREVLQVVLLGGEAVATIGVVADGELYTIIPEAQGANSALVPEPASLGLLAVGGLLMIRRR